MEVIFVKIIRATHMGFCVGAGCSCDKVLELLKYKNQGKVYILGNLVHNHEVMDKLLDQGIVVINDYKQIKDSMVVTPAHGVRKEVIEELERNNNKVIDLTCPNVEKVRKAALELLHIEKVELIILIGQSGHAEVEATCSWISPCFVVTNIDDVYRLPQVNTVGVIAQTTFYVPKFESICEQIKIRIPKTILRCTICPHTILNQETSRDIATKSDMVLVIGDSTSSNTNSLYKVCKSVNKQTWLISKKDDLNEISGISSSDTIGLTAGASTPDWIIDEIESELTEKYTK